MKNFLELNVDLHLPSYRLFQGLPREDKEQEQMQ